jgi:hypothetical protein
MPKLDASLCWEWVIRELIDWSLGPPAFPDYPPHGGRERVDWYERARQYERERDATRVREHSPRPELPPGWSFRDTGADVWLCRVDHARGMSIYVMTSELREAMVGHAWETFAKEAPEWATYLNTVQASRDT